MCGVGRVAGWPQHASLWLFLILLTTMVVQYSLQFFGRCLVLREPPALAEKQGVILCPRLEEMKLDAQNVGYLFPLQKLSSCFSGKVDLIFHDPCFFCKIRRCVFRTLPPKK